MELMSVVFSFVAIVIAACSALYAKRTAQANAELAGIERARESRELARREAEAEAVKAADLRVALDRSASTAAIVLTNNGPAAARNITLQLYGIAAENPPWADIDNPIEELRAGSSLRFRCALDYDVTPTFRAGVWWTDDRGRNQDESTVLHV